MTSRRRKVKERLLLESKVLFMGRFKAHNINEYSLGRLRERLASVRGASMKLRLSMAGISSRHRNFWGNSGGPSEDSIPLKEVHDLRLENGSVLLVVSRPTKQWQILAYKCRRVGDANLFVQTFHEITGRVGSSASPVQTSTAVSKQQRTPDPIVIKGRAEANGNWSLHQTTEDERLSSMPRHDSNGNSLAERALINAQRQNGGVRVHVEPDAHSFRPRSRRLSDASELSTMTIQQKLDGLEDEVEHLRTLLRARNLDDDQTTVRSDARSHTAERAPSFASSSRQSDATLVDGKHGVVRAYAGDYRTIGVRSTQEVPRSYAFRRSQSAYDEDFERDVTAQQNDGPIILRAKSAADYEDTTGDTTLRSVSRQGRAASPNLVYASRTPSRAQSVEGRWRSRSRIQSEAASSVMTRPAGRILRKVEHVPGEPNYVVVHERRDDSSTRTLEPL